MGAGAGMSGSPLYIDGRLAGALSYQLQRFETIPHAGFTPIDDLIEVSACPRRRRFLSGAILSKRRMPQTRAGRRTRRFNRGFGFVLSSSDSGFHPERNRSAGRRYLRSTISRLGADVANAGGSYGFQAEPQSAMDDGARSPVRAFPEPCTPATPSRWRSPPAISPSPAPARCRGGGTHLLAFGHPLMDLGAVDLPMASSEVSRSCQV